MVELSQGTWSISAEAAGNDQQLVKVSFTDKGIKDAPLAGWFLIWQEFWNPELCMDGPLSQKMLLMVTMTESIAASLPDTFRDAGQTKVFIEMQRGEKIMTISSRKKGRLPIANDTGYFFCDVTDGDGKESNYVVSVAELSPVLLDNLLRFGKARSGKLVTWYKNPSGGWVQA